MKAQTKGQTRKNESNICYKEGKNMQKERKNSKCRAVKRDGGYMVECDGELVNDEPMPREKARMMAEEMNQKKKGKK
jgi:hypothetical protein